MQDRGKPSHNLLERRVARLRSVQALFQMEASGADVDQVSLDFENGELSDSVEDVEIGRGDMAFFLLLVNGAVENQRQIDQATEKALVDSWPLGRIDPTLRALFRSACAELISRKVPPRVTISEFVEIADAFFPDGRSSKLVNAVLDNIARQVRPDEFS